MRVEIEASKIEKEAKKKKMEKEQEAVRQFVAERVSGHDAIMFLLCVSLCVYSLLLRLSAYLYAHLNFIDLCSAKKKRSSSSR